MAQPAPQPAASSSRVTSLDGLRGVAACAVIAFHFGYAFTPGSFMDYGRTGFGFFDLPIAVLWNGHFAVAVFFALSGFVLAASSPRSAREAPLMIGLRYLRLAVPALASSMLAWAWLTSFPHAGHEAQMLSGSSWFRWTYQAPIPPLSQAMWEGAIGVFLEGTTRFKNPLWTMRTEFFGSLLIYGSYALVTGRLRPPGLVIGMIGLSLAGQFDLAAFCGGALIYEMRGHLRDLPVAGAAMGFAGLVVGATYPGHADGPVLAAMVLSRLGSDGFRQAGALLLILSVLTTPRMRRAFELRAMQRLGELSFPIYLVHVPLIVGPAAWAYAQLYPMSPGALAGLFALVVVGTFLLGGVLLVLVDRPVLAVLKIIRTNGRARLAAS